MVEAALKAEIWIKAQIRICDLNFLSAVVVRRGDSDAGAILLKLDRLAGGIEIFAQARDNNGEKAWICGTGQTPVSEDEANLYLEKQIKYDPDIWILEIEDPKYKYLIDGNVL